ncbi:MAG: AIR synthase-related protein, partial [bacterium]
LASVLNELVQYRNLGINIDETQIPIREGVRGACEIFGFDPLYVANEGKVVIIVDPKDSDKIISILQNNPLGKDASIIGSVTSENPRKVLMRTTIGGSRIVDMLAGEQLPRIC